MRRLIRRFKTVGSQSVNLKGQVNNLTFVGGGGGVEDLRKKLPAQPLQ